MQKSLLTGALATGLVRKSVEINLPVPFLALPVLTSLWRVAIFLEGKALKRTCLYNFCLAFAHFFTAYLELLETRFSEPIWHKVTRRLSVLPPLHKVI